MGYKKAHAGECEQSSLKHARWYATALSAIRSTPPQVLYRTTKRLPTTLDQIIFVQSVAKALPEEISYGAIFKHFTDSVNNAVSVATSCNGRTI